MKQGKKLEYELENTPLGGNEITFTKKMPLKS